MKNIRPLLGVLATAAALTQATAWADSAINIQSSYSFGAPVSFDDTANSGDFPVVTAILSRPGTVTGTAGTRTYGNWSYLAQDSTGSLDLFYSSTAAGPLAHYPNPTVGDTISVVGVWSPFSGIAEIANGSQAIDVTGPGSTGNPPYTPVPQLTTIPVVNVGTNSHGISASGLATQLLQLNNVTISGLGANWSGNPNLNATGQITDASNNGMTLFVWGTSYSTCGAMIGSGAAIPTGPVDMTGFVSDFYNSTANVTVAEFVPVSIIAVPEPATLGLCGLGSVLAWVCYRRSKKA